MISRRALLAALAFAPTLARAQLFNPGAPTLAERAGLIAAAGWSPSDLGASLIALWDAERSDLITQAAGAVSSWRDAIVVINTQGLILNDNGMRNVMHGIRLLGTDVLPISDVTCSNNRVVGNTLPALQANYVNRMTVNGFASSSGVGESVHYANCTGLSHGGGYIKTSGPTINAFTILDCQKVILTGVNLDGGGSDSVSRSIGIWITGASSDISVSGGIVMGYWFPVRATTGTFDYLTAIGINGRNCGAPIDLAEAAHNVNTGNL